MSENVPLWVKIRDSTYRCQYLFFIFCGAKNEGGKEVRKQRSEVREGTQAGEEGRGGGDGARREQP